MNRARGMALLTALILLALATAIAAAITFDTGMALRRAQGSAAQEQALWVASGTEAIAAEVLREQLAEAADVIRPGQPWSAPLGPLEAIDGVIVEAQVEDLQGRFNLNSLIDMDGKSDPAAREVLEQLLQVLEIEPQIAARMSDWIDADDEAQPGGAEESVYSALPVPYRPPNRPITSISELLLLEGMDAERYARLAPHVTALPRDAAINLCSARGVLLDALSGERQWSRDPEGLARNRQRSCFPGREAFRNTLGNPQQFERLERSLGLGERSMYFRVRTLASVGTAQFSLYSLLRHEGTTPGEPRLRVMQRQFSE